MAEIRFFDCFAGIGGFRSGLEKAGGFKCVGFCEIDKHAAKAYKAIFDAAEEVYFEDISRVRPADLPPFDLFVGGFPCQPFSIAGNRRGFMDARGTLFYHIARILRGRHPPCFILENVPYE